MRGYAPCIHAETISMPATMHACMGMDELGCGLCSASTLALCVCMNSAAFVFSLIGIAANEHSRQHCSHHAVQVRLDKQGYGRGGLMRHGSIAAPKLVRALLQFCMGALGTF